VTILGAVLINNDVRSQLAPDGWNEVCKCVLLTPRDLDCRCSNSEAFGAKRKSDALRSSAVLTSLTLAV
jgi:hypothetical protein